MSRWIEKIFVVTTGHVPECICHSLETDYASLRSEYGLMLHVSHSARWESLHDNLQQLAEIARKRNCCWLLMDCDADAHPDVSLFDW